MDVELPVLIERQPDYVTCGATRLIGAIFPGSGSDDGSLLRVRPGDWQEDWQEGRAGRRA